jgi:hypothetical protein
MRASDGKVVEPWGGKSVLPEAATRRLACRDTVTITGDAYEVVNQFEEYANRMDRMNRIQEIDSFIH